MTHEHIATAIEWVTLTDSYSRQESVCPCGQRLERETTPLGSKPNWNEWKEITPHENCAMCESGIAENHQREEAK